MSCYDNHSDDCRKKEKDEAFNLIALIELLLLLPLGAILIIGAC